MRGPGDGNRRGPFSCQGWGCRPWPSRSAVGAAGGRVFERPSLRGSDRRVIAVAAVTVVVLGFPVSDNCGDPLTTSCTGPVAELVRGLPCAQCVRVAGTGELPRKPGPVRARAAVWFRHSDVSRVATGATISLADKGFADNGLTGKGKAPGGLLRRGLGMVAGRWDQRWPASGSSKDSDGNWNSSVIASE